MVNEVEMGDGNEYWKRWACRVKIFYLIRGKIVNLKRWKNYEWCDNRVFH